MNNFNESQPLFSATCGSARKVQGIVYFEFSGKQLTKFALTSIVSIYASRGFSLQNLQDFLLK